MANQLSHFPIVIRPGRTLALETAPGESIHVVNGLVWATTTGNPGDLWLRTGHRHMLERRGVTVVEAPRGATVELIAGRASGLFRDFVGRLFSFFASRERSDP